MATSDFARQLEGYGLTTANDLAPNFPGLQRFLDFWRREIEGPLHSVTVAHQRLVSPAECRMVAAEYRLH
jgi:uncharacterized protein Usg